MKINIFALVLCVMFLSSCNKWLEIRPIDRESEGMMFDSRQGYLKALNGVYLELVKDNGYGQDLTVGCVDVLAKYYQIETMHSMNSWTSGNYKSNELFKKVDLIWTQMYKLIVNCNTIIEKCGEKENVLLPGNYFGMVKGEALGLRAMLHFDLLRLWGPVWADGKEDTKCIPYCASSNQKIQPLLPAKEILDLVIKDLKDAEMLLAEADIVREEGVKHVDNPSGSNDMNYRQYRMNYFAVKALLARAYLWKHDRVEAMKYAKAVIDEGQLEGKEIFPFVTPEDANKLGGEDRKFGSEVLFGLYNSLQNTRVQIKYFNYNIVNTSILTIPAERSKSMYDDTNDFRFKTWVSVKDKENNDMIYLTKYQRAEKSVYNEMQPLIRISEMYLILAEGLYAEDLDLATSYLNKVRSKRNCVSLYPTADTFASAIEDEFRREVIGEGQMWFYCKRNFMTSIQTGSGVMENVSREQYTFPLPESEIGQRGE